MQILSAACGRNGIGTGAASGMMCVGTKAEVDMAAAHGWPALIAIRGDAAACIAYSAKPHHYSKSCGCSISASPPKNMASRQAMASVNHSGQTVPDTTVISG
ncbi:unnamed protein product [Phytophthora fragariaefolia]|uniref:Unnamed protein product n=1 Tax=Phytophthora fragariaefolia TaxID=1490495 RepID=A0A9W6TSN6_9STRA|nr:unnamed protein product [Phytophthora fragariaefolia]